MTLNPQRRTFRFSLRTLFVLTAICAVASPGILPLYHWLFPPTLSDAELIELIVTTVKPSSGWDDTFLGGPPDAQQWNQIIGTTSSGENDK